MNCIFCNLAVGETFTIETSSYWGCIYCNASLLSFLPIDAIYTGKDDNEHWFIFVNPFPCLGCGELIRGTIQLCEGDGYSIEMPLLIEIPIEENK